MPGNPDRKIQKIERKIIILKRVFIVGIILIVISFCCMAALMYRISQLQNELNEMDRESDEITIEEHLQRLDESNRELDTFWFYNIISMSFFWAGITLQTVGYRYKKFNKLRKSYLRQSEGGTKLSFIVEEKLLIFKFPSTFFLHNTSPISERLLPSIVSISSL